MSALLQMRLSVDYASKKDVLREVELEIRDREILGLAGESGSGKSTIALSILGLLDHKRGFARGQILFGGHDLLRLPPKEMRKVRGHEIALVLQSPLASLNPALKIGTQMAEAWRAHKSGAKQWRQHAIEAFELVHLPQPEVFLNRYPREVSVGQAQRILIAMAILHRPRLLIADEATSALDAITQSEILQLFRRLNGELDMAILFISHDLLSVASLCGRVAILHAGRIVECGATEEIFSHPRESYTRALLNALPHQPFKVSEDLQALADQLASPASRDVRQPVA